MIGILLQKINLAGVCKSYWREKRVKERERGNEKEGEREGERGVRERKGRKGADHLGSWRGKLIHFIIVLHDCVVFLLLTFST